MVEIDVVYQGDLRCEARHLPSGETLVTDAPADNEGRGGSFSPTDLLATALGTCMLTIMGIAARRHGLDLTGTTVRVVKTMVADPRRRIGRLDVTIRLNRRFTTDERRLLETAATTCPVTASLRPEVEIPIRFEEPA